MKWSASRENPAVRGAQPPHFTDFTDLTDFTFPSSHPISGSVKHPVKNFTQ